MPDKRIDHILAGHAASRPDSPAISFAGTTISYAELESQVASMAGWLVRSGIAAGDRIAGVWITACEASFLFLHERTCGVHVRQG